MKILVLAPHPFYQERGTPIAVDLLLKALSERGDQLDLLTFHEGHDRHYRNVTIYRIHPLLNISHIRPGFSAKKLFCDIFLLVKLLSLIRRQRYDIVHAIEESAFMTWLVCPLLGIPFIYDMDSSMVTQLIDKHSFLRYLEKPLRFIESLPMRKARAVVPVCEALAEHVSRYRVDSVFILKDVSLLQKNSTARPAHRLREELALENKNSTKIAMYIGNLEPYQGIDLMLQSFALLRRSSSVIDMVIIGGNEADIKKYRQLAQQLGIADATHILGPRPVAHIGAYMKQADILISPRIQGVNTPMKVYSYLHSGVAVLATDLPTHTQIMTAENAMLAKPDPQSFATAWQKLLTDDQLRNRLAKTAHAFIEREHSYPAFKTKLYSLYELLEQEIRLQQQVR
jgi:glycosyltransferase involved in cell wall biosynthesis